MKTSKEQKDVAVTEQQADNALDSFKEGFELLCAELHEHIPKERVGIAGCIVINHSPGIDCANNSAHTMLAGVNLMINKAVSTIVLADFKRGQ